MALEQVVPLLRKEFDALRPAHVPEAPTHHSLKAAAEQRTVDQLAAADPCACAWTSR